MPVNKSARRLSLDSVRNLTFGYEKRKSRNGYESDTSPLATKRKNKASIFQKLVTPRKSSRRASVGGVELEKNSKESNSSVKNKETDTTTQLEVTRRTKGLCYGEKTAILECIKFLDEEPHALEVEGIFRINGSFSQMQNLRALLKKNKRIPRSYRKGTGEIPDPLAVADLLKDLLRSLKSPLLPKETGKRLLLTNQSNAGLNLLHVVNELDEDNKEVFEKLLQLLAKTSSLSLFNHMDSKNIATIFAPTLIDWDPLQRYARTELETLTEAIMSVINDHVICSSGTEQKEVKTRKHHSMPLHLQPNPFYNPPKYLLVSKQRTHDTEIDSRDGIRSLPKIKDSRRPKESLQWKPLSDQERTSFDASFHAVDVSDKGSISASEGIEFLSKFNLSLEQVALIWSLVDRNDSGFLGIREWRVAMALCMGLNRNCSIPKELPAVLEQELMETCSFPIETPRANESTENFSFCSATISSSIDRKAPHSIRESAQEPEFGLRDSQVCNFVNSDWHASEEHMLIKTVHVEEQLAYDQALESIRYLWIEQTPEQENCNYMMRQKENYLDPLTRRKLLGRGFHG